MKTAMEIFDEKCNLGDILPNNEMVTVYYPYAIAAMEEYAQEVAKNLHKPLVSGSLLADAWKELSEFQDAAGFKSSAIAEVLASNDR